MKNKDIKFLKFVYLRGPNMWAYCPTLEAWVDIGDLEDCPSNTIPGFYERLSNWLPSLVEHRCSYDERGGFLRRVEEGTWPAHIMEHVTIELQNLAGLPGGFGRAREASQRSHYKVMIECYNVELTKAALYTARDLIMAAIEDRPFDVAGAIAELRDRVDSEYLGPSTGCIVEAAKVREIPFMRLSETSNLVQFGYGARQRRIWTAETDRTSAIAESISRDKDLTKSLLSACGIPVPEGRVVTSPEDAWEAAEDIGLPVVVKPTDGNHGRAVFTDLNTREEVESAYRIAVDEGSGVIVERFIRGLEHRLLVVGNRVVAAARGEEAWVTGDGQHSIRELIELQLNSDPRRGRSEEHPLNPVTIDTGVRIDLERQQLTPDSVPAAGRAVLIQRNGNVAFDVTDRIHPEVAEAVALAARTVGLDIAGIDLVAQDISRPLAEQGGAIVEVNAGPGLLMHLKPADGQPRPVGEAIIEHLFPQGDDGRIPVIGISGSRGKTSVARLINRILKLTGKHVGVATSDGLFLAERQIVAGDAATGDAAERILKNRAVEIALFESSIGAIAREGVVYDRTQVSVVTNMDADYTLPDCDLHTTEKIYAVLRTLVDIVVPGGTAVLNAEDPQVADMARLSKGSVIFFARNPEHPVIREHLAADKRAVLLRNGHIVLAIGNSSLDLTALCDVPLPEVTDEHIDNVLAAVGAAWALELTPDLISAGISRC